MSDINFYIECEYCGRSRHISKQTACLIPCDRYRADLDALRAENANLRAQLEAMEWCRATLERISNDGTSGGMGGGLRRDGDDLRDIAREALGGKR